MGNALEYPARATQLRIINLLLFAIVVTAQILKQRSQETAVVSIVTTLTLVGGLILWDQDRWKKAGFSGPFWLHMAALEMGILSGWLSAYVFQDRNLWWQALLLQSSQMLLFFTLVELATDKRMRKDLLYNLTLISCMSAHMLTSPRPLFDTRAGYFDFFLLTIVGSSLIAGSIQVIRQDLDPVPMERRYVFIWVGTSNVIILGWKMFAGR